MNKKAVIAIMILLLLAGIIFIASRFLATQKEQEIAVITEQEKIIVGEAPAKIEEPAMEEPFVMEPPKEAPKKQSSGKEPKYRKVFMGNRGYLVKDAESTFIRPSILEELKKNNYYKCILEQ